MAWAKSTQVSAHIHDVMKHLKLCSDLFLSTILSLKDLWRSSGLLMVSAFSSKLGSQGLNPVQEHRVAGQDTLLSSLSTKVCKWVLVDQLPIRTLIGQNRQCKALIINKPPAPLPFLPLLPPSLLPSLPHHPVQFFLLAKTTFQHMVNPVATMQSDMSSTWQKRS